MSKIILYFISALLVLLIDQGSKWVMLTYYQAIIVFNTRGTWGILPVWTALVGIVGLILFLVFKRQLTLPLWIIFIAGISNLIDRIWHPGVLDFMRVGSFPVFNLADSMITVAVIWVLYTELFLKNETH